jgi:hypothetical protein
VARSKASAKLSVFKGREAKLNRAIFQTLALKGPQTIYDIHKTFRHTRGFKNTRYASVNKRIRKLQESDFVRKAGTKETRAGFKACTYELCAKTHLAILLESVNLEDFFVHVSEDISLSILGALVLRIPSNCIVDI